MSELNQSLRVFISYARSDCGAFAEELMLALDAAGFDPFLDRHDIAAGEDWQTRLGALLQQADTVVYVLSPAFVKSQRCAWEIDQARALSKRVIPIVALDVAESDTPEALRRLNYIYFSSGHSFAAGLKALSTALRVDLSWIREHTRLGEIAARWRDMKRSEALLLRGSEMEDAKSWLVSWKSPAPEPTELHRDFINDSEAAERDRFGAERKRLEEKDRLLKNVARRNLLIGSIVVLLLVVTLGAAYFVYQLRGQLEAKKEELAEAQDANKSKEAKLAEAESALQTLRQNIQTVPSGPQTEQYSKDVQDFVRKARISAGWDIDVFWCEGPGGEQNKNRAEAILKLLTNEQERQLQSNGTTTAGLSLPLGRIRPRSLSEAMQARPGYKIQVDVMRAETGEVEQGNALRAFIIRQGPSLEAGRSDTPTPNYLSVFMCSASGP